MRSRASIISTLMPAACSSRAAIRPANPAPITTTCFFVTAFSFRVSVLCLVCGSIVVIQRSLGYRNLLVVAEHVMVTHCFVVLRTTALNDFSPDQAKNATDNDQTGHDVDQRGACFGVDHQLEVDQDHN